MAKWGSAWGRPRGANRQEGSCGASPAAWATKVAGEGVQDTWVEVAEDVSGSAVAASGGLPPASASGSSVPRGPSREGTPSALLASSARAS